MLTMCIVKLSDIIVSEHIRQTCHVASIPHNNALTFQYIILLNPVKSRDENFPLWNLGGPALGGYSCHGTT